MCTAQQSVSAYRAYRALLGMPALGCLFLAMTIVLTSATTARANQYDDVAEQVRSLAKSPYVQLLDIGKSRQGRSIPAFVISEFTVDSSQKSRVLLIAGQHGNEYNPVQIILDYCDKLIQGSDQRILERCIVIVAPAVNVDGVAANNRFSGDDVDINRDWQARRTPETRYVDALIEQWRPQVILDMHEWTGPSDVPGNAIEVAHVSAIRQKEAMTALASAISEQAGLAVIQCSSNSDSRLFHRRYSELGYASFLLETAAGLSYANKSRSYAAAIDIMIETVTENVEVRAQLSPSATDFDMAAVSSHLKPKEPVLSVDTRLWPLAAILVAYCAILWVLKPFASKNEAVWSHRFVKCDVDFADPTHPLIKKRRLQPLIYRSWSRRRIRVRYLEDADVEPSSETPHS